MTIGIVFFGASTWFAERGNAAVATLEEPDAALMAPETEFRVLGIDIRDVPHSPGIAAFLGALEKQQSGLPWARALVRHEVTAGGRRQDSVFVPVNNMREAFELCQKLADIPPACAPEVASNFELRNVDGSLVTKAGLAKDGVNSYHRQERWSRVAALDDQARFGATF